MQNGFLNGFKKLSGFTLINKKTSILTIPALLIVEIKLTNVLQ